MPESATPRAATIAQRAEDVARGDVRPTATVTSRRASLMRCATSRSMATPLPRREAHLDPAGSPSYATTALPSSRTPDPSKSLVVHSSSKSAAYGAASAGEAISRRLFS